MKAVTRQRPKNANYSVSSNPTHTNGAPLKAKPRTRQPEKQPQRPKAEGKQPKCEDEGGKMTKFRSLDDIPDFTDDFGRDKSNIEIVNSPHVSPDPTTEYSSASASQYDSSPFKKQSVGVSAYGHSANTNSAHRQTPPVLRGPPPPLPHEHMKKNQNKQNLVEYLSPQRRNNAPTACFDNNSCGSVDTDLSDDDDDCNNSYFSSTDDYHVNYMPSSKLGVSQQNNVILTMCAVKILYLIGAISIAYRAVHKRIEW